MFHDYVTVHNFQLSLYLWEGTEHQIFTYNRRHQLATDGKIEASL